MKVLLVNGGPHKDGCTNVALEEVRKTLEKEGIETETFWLGTNSIGGCIGCNYCLKNNNRCFMNDIVNEFLNKVEDVDGFVFGSPVHFAAASGSITSFLDRAFYGRGNLFKGKLYASVVSCRRGGAVGAFDQLNKYALMSNMYVVRKFLLESNTWNYKRRSYQRFRRIANNEKFRKKYGIYAKMHKSRRKSRCRNTCLRKFRKN